LKGQGEAPPPLKFGTPTLRRRSLLVKSGHFPLISMIKSRSTKFEGEVGGIPNLNPPPLNLVPIIVNIVFESFFIDFNDSK